jgi:hypothetical protein
MTKHILETIQKDSFKFFMDFTNFNEFENGYGLTLDNSANENRASIASVGFMLSSLVIGVNYSYIDQEKALYIARKTLYNLLHHVPHFEGFFAHYVDFHTAIRYKKCEYSTIDTMLALCGVLTVDQFFNDLEITKLAKELFYRINFEKFIFQKDNKLLLHMAYNPDKDGDYVKTNPGFIYQWDMFAEQLAMYVMIAGSKYKNYALDLYNGFNRNIGNYKDYEYIYSPGNALFIYQFPLAWLDIENVVDLNGINWFQNAKTATLAHQQAAIDHKDQYPGFSKYLFGFSASDSKYGYRVYGGLPNYENELRTDGTLSPFSMIGSLNLLPKTILKSIEKMLQINGLYSKYGFYDAFNIGENWISNRFFSINKGLELLMINQYLSKDVTKCFMNHEIIVNGMKELGWKKI